MSYPCEWPTLAELKKIVDVDPNSTEFDVTIQRQLDAAISFVKSQVGEWDDVIDVCNDQLSGAVLRAAFLFSLKQSPATVARDPIFMTFMSGQHRRFAIA